MVPEKSYADPGSDLEVTWAQRKSTALSCFGNCEILATLMQKLLKQKNPQKNALKHLGKN